MNEIHSKATNYIFYIRYIFIFYFLNSPVSAELVFYLMTQTVLETSEIQINRKLLSFR